MHGHEIGENAAIIIAAEMVGTFILVLAIGATAVPAVLKTPIAGTPLGSEAVALAGASTLVIVVASLGQVSGAHVNPAVTLGLAVTGRFPWMYVPAYLAAQLGGSCLAALFVWCADGPAARSTAHLAATQPAPGVGAWRVLLVEGAVSFILVLVVLFVGNDPRVSRAGAAVVIGLALGVSIFIGGPITGAGVNPARALGPMIVANRFTDWWAYLIGPVGAGIGAAALYEVLLARGTNDMTSVPAEHG
jgi:MIP family channel proteins